MVEIKKLIIENRYWLINYSIATIFIEIFIISIFIYNITVALSIITFIVVTLTFFNTYPKIMDWATLKPNLVIDGIIIDELESQIKIIIKNNGEATAYFEQQIRYIISNKDDNVVVSETSVIPVIMLPNKIYVRKISTNRLNKNEDYELRFTLVDREYKHPIKL